MSLAEFFSSLWRQGGECEFSKAQLVKARSQLATFSLCAVQAFMGEGYLCM